jgi:hypothetical protein
MADISTHGFDGSSGGRIEGGPSQVHPQPDFANMTLEEIQAWELANNTNPLTQAAPASAVTPLHATEESAAAAQIVPSLAVVPESPPEAQGYAYEPRPEPDTEPETIRAEFSLGEPFVHVVAYLLAGPVEIIATPAEALELYNKLGLALGAAQRAGVIA